MNKIICCSGRNTLQLQTQLLVHLEKVVVFEDTSLFYYFVSPTNLYLTIFFAMLMRKYDLLLDKINTVWWRNLWNYVYKSCYCFTMVWLSNCIQTLCCIALLHNCATMTMHQFLCILHLIGISVTTSVARWYWFATDFKTEFHSTQWWPS